MEASEPATNEMKLKIDVAPSFPRPLFITRGSHAFRNVGNRRNQLADLELPTTPDDDTIKQAESGPYFA